MTAGEWQIDKHEHATNMWVIARNVEDGEGRGCKEYLCQDGKPVTFGSETSAGAIVALLNRGTIAPLNQNRRKVTLEIRYRVEPELERRGGTAESILAQVNRIGDFIDSVEVVE